MIHKKTRIGVVGCGVISKVYLSNIRERFPSLEVRACADQVPEKARTAAELSGAAACTVEDLLADPEVDLVLNLTVPAAHTEITRKALNAGKHIYSEKPLALTQKDAADIAGTARRKGLLVGCAPDTFLGAGLQTCRKLLDDGWIGTPVFAVANMISHGTESWHTAPGFYYQPGGGPMMDMGPYYLTALVSLLGPVKRLACCRSRALDERPVYSNGPLKGTKIPVEVPTHYSGILEMASGVPVSMNMSFDVWRSHLPKLEIYGTEGTLILPDPNTFSGPVRVLRGSRLLDRLTDHPPFGNDDPEDWPEMYSEIPLVQPDLGNLRGLGLLDMALALEEGYAPRAGLELSAHITEALLGFDSAAETGGFYPMKSTCRRPDPVPESGLPIER